MALTSPISPYDDMWPKRFQQEAARLAPIFNVALRNIHHIGSTAVPGLAAKPEIDVLVVVSSSTDLELWTRSLSNLGYRRGGDLRNGHHFFRRDVDGRRTHKLHVCPSDHHDVLRMLKFRDHLRENLNDRLAYQELKFKLEEENTMGIAEYLEGKAPFIESILSRI